MSNPATGVQTDMIRKIRGLDPFADLGDLTAEDAITEIKAAMAAGFDLKKAYAAEAKATSRQRIRCFCSGRCTCDQYIGQ